MVDYLTKWPQAYLLRTKTATEVMECTIKFFHQFEAPKRVLTDQGREFVNEINKNLYAKLEIKRSLCSPYHPQTNRLVERMNGTIQRALSKLGAKKAENWDEYLDAVMFGLRTKKQIITKFSPFFLMFRREAWYPTEVPEHFMVDSSAEDVVAEEAVSEDIKRLDEIKDIVHDNVTKQQEKAMKQMKQGAAKPGFKIGDKVWRQNVRSQQRKGGKLEANFLGPLTVTTLQGKSADLLAEDGTVFNKINVDHLKIAKEQLPRIPHKIKKSVATAPSASPAAPASTGPVSAVTSPAPIYAHASVEKYVQEAWAGKDVHVLLSKVGPYKLFFWDIENTGPNKELESEVINAYLMVLVKKYNQCNAGEAAYIDTYAMTAIWKKKFGKIRIDPAAHKIILEIVNKNHHWMLVVMYPHEKRTLFLDPLRESKGKMKVPGVYKSIHEEKRLKYFKVDMQLSPSWMSARWHILWCPSLKKEILQGVAIDCDTSKKAVHKMRLDIASSLLRESDDLSSLCFYCGMEDQDETQWVIS